MIPALAQISTDQIHPLVQFIVGGSAAVFLLNQAITFWKDHMREQPTPSDTYATKQEMKEAHGRMSRERDETRALIVAAEGRMQAECSRIAAEVAGYNTNAEDRATRINNRIDDLSDKVAEAPEKVVEMLVRTKGLLG